MMLLKVDNKSQREGLTITSLGPLGTELFLCHIYTNLKEGGVVDMKRMGIVQRAMSVGVATEAKRSPGFS